MANQGLEAVGPIMESISLGRTDIVKTLLEEVKKNSLNDAEFKSFLNQVHDDDGTFLHHASKDNQQDIILALLQLGADPSVKNAAQETFLSKQPIDVSKSLLPGILTALASSNIILMTQLLEAGLDANLAEGDGDRNALLHWAASYSTPEMSALLIRSGANVNVKNAHGVTPLHEAVDKKAEQVASVLVEAGADVNAIAEAGLFEGKSPLDLIRTSDFHWSSSFLNSLHLQNGMAHDNSVGSNKSISELGEEMKESLQITVPSPTSSKTLSINGPVSPLAPVITDERLNLIWPQPALIKQLEGEPYIFPSLLPLTVSSSGISVHRILDVIDLHRNRLKSLGKRIFLHESHPNDSAFGDESPATVLCQMREGLFHTKGAYTVHISPKKIRLSASDLEGLHFALCTLLQMFTLFKDEGLIPVVITDKPEFAIRGALMDMNPYGRVPKMEILMQFVEIFSYLKINHFQGFVRISRNSTWSFGVTKSDLLSLHRFCKDRFVDFIPAIDVDSSVTIEDLPLLRPKIDEVLRCFDRPNFVHVGPALTALIFGSAEANRFCDMLFGDVPNLMVCANTLPRQSNDSMLSVNLVALQYGFKTNQARGGFTGALSSVQDLGLPGIGVCTGTRAWSNLAGSPSTMLSNVSAGHMALSKLHGSVSLIAQWSSDPAFCHSIFAWPGYVAAAGMAWNPDTPTGFLEFVMDDLLNHHVIGDTSFPWGKVIMDLGRAESSIEALDSNSSTSSAQHESGSTLLNILINPDDVSLQGISHDQVVASHQLLKKSLNQLLNGMPTEAASNERLEVVRHELQLTAELLQVSVRIVRGLIQSGLNPDKGSPGLPIINCGIAGLSPTFKTDMANKLLSLIEQYRALWLSRYEPPGLYPCMRILNNLLNMFVPEGADLSY